MIVPVDERNGDDERVNQLIELSVQSQSCTACHLSQTRTKVVFGEGNPKAPLVFVGEGPGQQEDATGRPFVGRAGALLDECLLECRLTRKHVYICNVVKCRACEIENGRARNRAPRPDEIEACFHWLDQQLRLIAPLVIICLGAPSANTLIHKNFRMLQERGTWFNSSLYARYIMATLHPAYILRQDAEGYASGRAQLIGDIESARKKVAAARKETPTTLF